LARVAAVALGIDPVFEIDQNIVALVVAVNEARFANAQGLIFLVASIALDDRLQNVDWLRA